MQKPVWPGWETGEQIGKGGFGAVYEIQREVFGDIEKNALKVISLPVDDSEVDELRAEGVDDASIAASVKDQASIIAQEYKFMQELSDTANVVHCYDISSEQKQDGIGWNIYIRMELLTPMMKILDKFKTENHIIRFALDICNGLAACHDANLIHRDIKPQNILYGKGRFKIGDFGIARLSTRSGAATAGVGSTPYMAPEVELAEPYDKTVDIYSLGLVLYWLLNDHRGPFLPAVPAVPTHEEVNTARRKRMHGEQIPAPKYGTPELQRIVLKACAYNPRDRYQSAKEMMRDLYELRKARGSGQDIPLSEPSAPQDIPNPDDEETQLDNVKSVSSRRKRSRNSDDKDDETRLGSANESGKILDDVIEKPVTGAAGRKNEKAGLEKADGKPARSSGGTYAAKNTGKKKGKGLFFLVALLVIVLGAASIAVGLGGKKENDTDQYGAEDDPAMVETSQETSIATEASETNTVATEAAATIPESVFDIVSPEDSQRDILIIHHSDDDGDYPDTYILLTYYRDNWRLSVSSILKDSYVSVPSYMDRNFGNTKLEYVYEIGKQLNGEQGAKDMVQACLKDNFGIEVDEIILTEDLGLKTVVDALDGVDVWVSMEDIDKITLLLMGNEVVNLDGESAVRYVRFDSYQSNIHRAECQRNLLISIIEECKTMPIADLIEVVNATYPWLNTSLSSEEVVRYILETSHFVIEERTYPAEGTYWGEIVDTTGSGELESVLKFGIEEEQTVPETTAAVNEEFVLELEKEDIMIGSGFGFKLLLKNDIDPTLATWYSNDEEVVTVNESGEIKAHKAGTTRVYVEYGGQTDSVIVRVIEN